MRKQKEDRDESSSVYQASMPELQGSSTQRGRACYLQRWTTQAKTRLTEALIDAR